MAIKTKISKVYAKARDRNYTHIYKDGRRFDSSLGIEKKIVHYSSGEPKLRSRKTCLELYSLDTRQVPEKSYETVRLSALKKLNSLFKNITKKDYCLRFNLYPHQLLRFHAIAHGARADRLSQGMRNSFGRVFCRAAKVKAGALFLQVFLSEKYSNRENFQVLKSTMSSLKCKLPFKAYFKLKDLESIPT